MLVVVILALIQSSAYPQQVRIFVDDSSYTFENYPSDYHRSIHGRKNETLAGHLCSFSSQLLDNHHRLLHPDEIHFSSHNCERFECDVVRGRAIGKFSPSLDYSQSNIDTPMDYVPVDA